MIRVFYTLMSFAVAHANPNDRPEKIRDAIYSFIGHVPGGAKLKCLLDDYTQIVDSAPSSAHPSLINYGLVTYLHADFEKQPPEVRRATKAFYDEAALILGRQSPSRVKSYADDQETPTLGERAGDANYPGLKPGWLWELALKHANGNPNLASLMIAVCGHDDTAQGEEEAPDEQGQSVRIFCPTGFPGELGLQPGFFLPESLGNGVDIPEKLRRRITNAQSPFACKDARSDGAKPSPEACLPAKHYHVYGGEYVACEMIARGHSPALVTELEAAMGWYYRAFWLGAVAAGCDDVAKLREDPDNPSTRRVSGWLDLLAELKHLGRKSSCSTSDLVDQLPYTRRKDCDQPTEDALFLIRKWTIFGKAGAPLGTLIPNLGANDVRDEDRPASWSDERFQLAKAKLRSIYSDFEWTMEQHRIGANFAAAHCKPDPAKVSKKTCQPR